VEAAGIGFAPPPETQCPGVAQYSGGLMPYPEDLKREALTALRKVQSIGPVAAAFRIDPQTLRKWATKARVKLPPARERMAEGAATQTGRRQVKWAGVYSLKDAGFSNLEIARQMNFKSLGSITHILKQRKLLP
jgi:hypothetical protein